MITKEDLKESMEYSERVKLCMKKHYNFKKTFYNERILSLANIKTTNINVLIKDNEKIGSFQSENKNISSAVKTYDLFCVDAHLIRMSL